MIKLIVFIVLFFFILYHFKVMKEEREEFISLNAKNQYENFESEIPSVNDIAVNSQVEKASEESYEEPISDDKENNTKSENNNKSEINNNNVESNEVCQKKTEGCMFGCPKDEVKVVSTEPRKTNLNEMLMTIEETEKICDLIEEKDRVRKEKEERDSLKKQIELNKKFLIQQKAQDKQIKDLEEIVKAMSFTHEMNKAAVEKCGRSQDECLSNKEKELKKLLLEKQRNTRQVKINLNFKDFGKEFMKHLTQKIGLNNTEMQNLLMLLNSGQINIDELKNQFMYPSQDQNYSDKQKFLNNANNECHKCKIDLSEYIDRCKIPCHKCRDPKWKCPQDI